MVDWQRAIGKLQKHNCMKQLDELKQTFKKEKSKLGQLEREQIHGISKLKFNKINDKL